MNKRKLMREIRDEFNDNTEFTGGYRFRWHAMRLFRDWARITGDHRSVDAVERFLKFVED